MEKLNFFEGSDEVRAKREPSSRNEYIKWPSGVFLRCEIAVISRAKSAVHKDIKVKNDEFTSVIPSVCSCRSDVTVCLVLVTPLFPFFLGTK